MNPPHPQKKEPKHRMITALPKIMGILNTTPDSFYAPSRVGAQAGTERALKMIQQGVDIIDLGGESSRPGSQYVGAAEEIRRLKPLLQSIRKASTIPLSIDTRKRKVAEACLDLGANWINDISSLEDDPEMASLLAERGCPVVLMHKQGDPQHMQINPQYQDVIQDIRDYFSRRLDYALAQGISEDQIILDPGIGFGKNLEDNLAILKRLREFRSLGRPLMIGLSRKSFIDKIFPSKPEERLPGTVVAHLRTLEQGVDYLRVHDVLETRQTLAVWAALQANTASGGRA
jgi:dihydropteroate synthase